MIQTGILLIHFLMHGVMFNPPLQPSVTALNGMKYELVNVTKKDDQATQYYEKNNIQSGEVDASFVEKYGSPEHEFVRPRYMFVGEYYIGLEKTYRSTDPRYSNVPIKEMFWHLHDDLNLTCWFHYKDEQWRVFSYIFWPPGAVF
ncbi:hypothetical protein O2Z13_002331 [Salmonella enterica]|uniref:Uncharacterized protein n=3 Tax=Salmonella enterica TaxID=28901 RepID=A0A5Y4SLY4_SALER|nr:hypothetical protein [Salmonella enterica]AKD13872.1 hypothetical protein AW70_33100 [Salmonella enterica subsp. enterica serovar Montevideo str. CDC 86-0391]EAM1504116.1 hypothetical protein [Salmonella enterica subsp. enterica]EBG9937206.1 hypothetical protein [Salmonella enterica subsp. enterica serovar Cerro]EBW3083004.1 hypothetical protein [Salmonella enterica subsp. enterica serovar Gueuletapee]EBW6544256.1 hypothetical protein [Salmonella enterica subsp. enterica serovar Durban]ECK